MLQGLKAADWLAELLSRLQVFHGRRMQCVHDADRFGAQRGHGPIQHRVNHRSGLIHGANHGIRTNLDPGELQIKRTSPVEQGIFLPAEILLVGRHNEQRDTALVRRRACGARRDNEFVCH